MSNPNRMAKKGKVVALVVTCMMLCTLSPAIADWNEDFVLADTYSGDDDPKELKYVSIGASNTNGFGMRGYISEEDIKEVLKNPHHKENANVFGFNKVPEGSYPDLIRDHYVSQGYTVDLAQLAMSSMRVEEVRILLDDSYYGDDYSEWRFTAGQNWFDKALPGGLDALRANYKSNVSEADLITIDIGWNNFGVYISHQLSEYLKSGTVKLDTDLSAIFDDEDELAMANQAKQFICDGIVEFIGIDDELATMLTDVFAYSLLGYIHNFDIVMEKIDELNPDADVVVIGIQNLLYDLVVEMDGNYLPIGDLYGYFVNLANYYIAHCSPYQDRYLYTMPGENGHVNLFLDYMKDYDGVAKDLDQNVKDCFDYYDNDLYISYRLDQIVADMFENQLGLPEGTGLNAVYAGKAGELDPSTQALFDSVYWNALYAAYDTLATLVREVANMEVLDLSDFDPSNVGSVESQLESALMGEIEENVMSAINGSGYTVDVDNLMFDAISNFVVTIHMRTGIGNSFFAHPDATGHEQICNAVINVLNNPETEKDQIPKDIVDCIADEIKSSLNKLDECIILFMDSPAGIELEVKFNEFYDDCNSTLAAIESGDIESIKDSLYGTYDSLNAFITYVEVLVDTAYNSDIYEDLKNQIIITSAEIQYYFDIIIVQGVLEKIVWEEVYAMFDTFMNELINVILDSDEYAEIRNTVISIRDAIESMSQEASNYVKAKIVEIYNSIMALFNNVDDEISESYLYNHMMPLDPPASGEVGTLVSLVDTLGSMYTSPEFIAEALGLEVDYDAYLPMGFRADDIVYLLGGTDAKDAFTDDLMINNAADMGLSVEAFRALYQTAVANSSAVVVNAGSDNLIFAITQSINIMNDVDTPELDFSKFDLVDNELYAEIMNIFNEIRALAEFLIDEGFTALEQFIKIAEVIETIAYSALGYVDNYAKIVEAIQALNPSTQIIVVGPYNFFDGFYFENAEPAFTIDIGAAFAPIIGGINSFNASQVAGMENVTYVDMTDMYQATEKVNVADLAGMDTDALLATILGSVSINEEGVLAQIQDITGSIAQVQYTIYFDINGDVQSETYFFGEVIDVPDVVADVGTVFVGWDADVPATMPACDLYFTAEFEPITYCIEFDANGGTGYMADMFAVYGDSVVLDANEFTYQGFNFAGWNTAANGTGVAYENGATVSNLCTVDGDVITLYAQWTAAPVPDVPENSDFDEATVTFVGYFILVLCIIAVIAGLVALKKE